MYSMKLVCSLRSTNISREGIADHANVNSATCHAHPLKWLISLETSVLQ